MRRWRDHGSHRPEGARRLRCRNRQFQGHSGGGVRRCPPGFPNVSFVLKDAQSSTFEEEFGTVFSNACLHWVIDHRPVLADVRRCLKPSGRVLLQMGGKGNAATVLRAIDTV